ncbi:YHS domain-containing protein [Methanolobus zinderi]|jgi:YHS domain-containing protein|uniref:YHS domain-containing protein n=1 Tax=Methanolobus zinderi TaxID=536044 RepID=A0A7D5E7Y1_9EURY|nr:YHS domain-containing protein [Methanolobus zinderi]QLC49978.1 YHS domain-containing protein [Methanolobus zinderi]
MVTIDPKATAVEDPVCHMKLDERTVNFKSEYKGETYNFCSLACKKKFDENPEKYLEFYT